MKLKLPWTKSAPIQVVRNDPSFCDQDSIAALRNSVYAMALRGQDIMFAYRAYDAAAPLATAVDLIAESLADIKPTIYDKELNEYDTDQEILSFLNDPGVGQDWRSLIVDAAISFLLTRNTYFNLLGGISGKPLAMVNLKPFWLTNRVSEQDGYIDTFWVSKSTHGRHLQYDRSSLKEWRFIANDLNELIHIKGQTDDDGLLGRSPIVALMLTILQNVAGGQHNAGLLANGGRPSGALVTDGTLEDGQFARLKEQIDADKTGPDNAGTPLLLEGGVSWQEMSTTNKDMDFFALLGMGREDTFTRYKIPIGLVSSKAMTLDNYSTSVVSLYDLAVTPLLSILLGGMSRVLMPRFGLDQARYTLTHDPLSIPAAMVKTGERVKLMAGINAFTDNELRSEFGKEPIEGGDVVWKPSTLIPDGVDTRTDDQPTPESADDRDDAQKTFVQLAAKSGMSVDRAEKLWTART